MNFDNSYAALDSRLFHKQPPTPLNQPKAGHFNPLVAKQIGWDADSQLMDKWVDILSGSFIPEGFKPLAMVYAGHQFGHWAGQLGDGRGLLMAQIRDVNGNLTDLHLKGMGLTPYSRMGDGRAVLRSTIREYLCGHAMSSLGIASSNALGFVSSETKVQREKIEQGAALLRVVDTHIRLGHIEWIANFAPDLLAPFTRYMISTYYPKLLKSQTPVKDFISKVIERTAKMIADWQLIGFAHGVMNTDNLNITGTTIDYGPFGFMERFNPAWINNHSDYTGRYAYQNQPAIGHWNLQIWSRHFKQLSQIKLVGESIEVIDEETLTNCLSGYETAFMQHYHQGICKKIGLPLHSNLTKASKTHSIEAISTLINSTLVLAFEFLEFVEFNRLDYTNSFRALVAVVANFEEDYLDKNIDMTHEQHLLESLENELDQDQLKRWRLWIQKYQQHIAKIINDPNLKPQDYDGSSYKHGFTKHSIIETIMQSNPAYILRNQMAQQAIQDAQNGDFNEVDRLFTLLSTPFDVNDNAKPQDTEPPSKNAPPIVISCSS